MLVGREGGKIASVESRNSAPSPSSNLLSTGNGVIYVKIHGFSSVKEFS